MGNYNADGKCVKCKKHAGNRSNKGLCQKCAIKNIKAASTQLIKKKGPLYEKWRQNLRASLDAE